jgi:hypothetical protein
MLRIATAAQNGRQYIHAIRRGAGIASCGVLMAPPFTPSLARATVAGIGEGPDPGFLELRI